MSINEHVVNNRVEMADASGEEDTRLMAFFDSLLMQEINGRASLTDDDNSEVYSDDEFYDSDDEILERARARALAKSRKVPSERSLKTARANDFTESSVIKDGEENGAIQKANCFCDGKSSVDDQCHKQHTNNYMGTNIVVSKTGNSLVCITSKDNPVEILQTAGVSTNTNNNKDRSKCGISLLGCSRTGQTTSVSNSHMRPKKKVLKFFRYNDMDDDSNSSEHGDSLQVSPSTNENSLLETFVSLRKPNNKHSMEFSRNQRRERFELRRRINSITSIRDMLDLCSSLGMDVVDIMSQLRNYESGAVSLPFAVAGNDLGPAATATGAHNSVGSDSHAGPVTSSAPNSVGSGVSPAVTVGSARGAIQSLRNSFSASQRERPRPRSPLLEGEIPQMVVLNINKYSDSSTSQDSISEHSIFQPPISEPSISLPSTSESSSTYEPSTCDSTSINHIFTLHVAPEPFTKQLSSSQPSTSEPSTSETFTSEPFTSEHCTVQSSISEPSTSKPSTSEPRSAQPSTSELCTSKHSTSEPRTAQPSTSEPPTAQASTSELCTSKPSTSTGISHNHSSFIKMNRPVLGFDSDSSSNDNIGNYNYSTFSVSCRPKPGALGYVPSGSAHKVSSAFARNGTSDFDPQRESDRNEIQRLAALERLKYVFEKDPTNFEIALASYLSLDPSTSSANNEPSRVMDLDSDFDLVDITFQPDGTYHLSGRVRFYDNILLCIREKRREKAVMHARWKARQRSMHILKEIMKRETLRRVRKERLENSRQERLARQNKRLQLIKQSTLNKSVRDRLAHDNDHSERYYFLIC